MTKEAKEVFEDLTLYVVVLVFVSSTVVGYLSGSTIEGILLKALIASGTIAFVGWLLAAILTSIHSQNGPSEGGAKREDAEAIKPLLKTEDSPAAEPGAAGERG